MRSEGEAAGFEAWIEGKNDKKRLNEYQIQHHPAKDSKPAYTECFLETIDEPFRMVVKKIDNFFIQLPFRARTRIDGNQLKNNVFTPGDDTISWEHVYEERGGSSFKGSLKFSPLITSTDDAAITISSDVLKKLGNIEILLESGTMTLKGSKQARASKLVSGVADERQLQSPMAVSSVNLKPVYRPIRNDYSFTPSERNGIQHRFLFKYRPRPVLITMGIIDKPAVPLPQVSANGELRLKEETQNRDLKADLRAKRLKFLEEQTKKM